MQTNGCTMLLGWPGENRLSTKQRPCSRLVKRIKRRMDSAYGERKAIVQPIGSDYSGSAGAVVFTVNEHGERLTKQNTKLRYNKPPNNQLVKNISIALFSRHKLNGRITS